MVENLIASENLSGIISDNRFGVRHKSIPSVFITHQLRVLSGNTTWLSSKLHQKIISKFNECWVPDHIKTKNLSGDLGHTESYQSSIKYIGPLSRLKKTNIPIKYNLLIVLSGPEPQRTLLEEHLLNELKSYKKEVCFVKGIVEETQTKSQKKHMTVYNFMTSEQLEVALNQSEFVLSRSGYTSIMDYSKLEKNVFFIPTPGQFEQEYLAQRFKSENIAPYSKQSKFKIEMLNDIENYSGFKHTPYHVNYKKLFNLF